MRMHEYAWARDALMQDSVSDDALYAAAMLLFSAPPLLSMRARRAMQQNDHLEPARVIAVVAFTILLWLQLRKRYQLGVAMVTLNLL
jgi:hypothetical protein